MQAYRATSSYKETQNADKKIKDVRQQYHSKKNYTYCGLMTDLGLIHSTIYPIILLRHRKPFHFKTSKIYRQEFEKSLHHFKENCYK